MTQPIANIPPQALETEVALLGACFLYQEVVGDALSKLIAKDFYRTSHQLIFEAITKLFQKNEPVDLYTVHNMLQADGYLDAAGGMAYLSELSSVVPSVAGYGAWSRIIREKSMLRRMIIMGANIQQLCYQGNTPIDEVMAEAEAALFAVTGAKDEEIDSIKKLIPPVIKTVTSRREIGSAVTGIPTGFHELDRMTAGLQATDLIILAGRPSMGKTALAMNIVRNASYHSKVPCLCFSLEMSKEQLTERLISCHGKVNSQGLRTGGLLDRDWDIMLKAADNLADIPIYLDDTPSLSITDIRVRTRRMVARHKVGLVVIDYLQLMRGHGGAGANRQQEISDISRGLKTLAKELKIPVIALSQLNRSLETRADKRPMMSDLRESGAIEQDADVIAFIYRDEVYRKDSAKQGIAEIIIGKQRHGPTGDFSVAFMKEFSRFEDLTNNHSEPWKNRK
ncbi:MAG: replicative DNA helicase [Proteobacteria bacterium]|nr:replicative DNA helicase [Pseudomonadota bacterium]